MKDEKKQIGKFNCRVISGTGEGPTLVFLHGFMFTGEIWNQIGLFPALEEKRIPFTAVDMPYGHHSECEPASSDPEDNITVVSQIAGDRDIVVGASIGGNIALRYAVDHPVRGLILIAPVRTLQDDLVKKYDELNVPVLIIYGENDNVVPKNEMEALSGRLNASLRIYDGAGHPAYKDLPERFNTDIISFCEKNRKRSQDTASDLFPGT